MISKRIGRRPVACWIFAMVVFAISRAATASTIYQIDNGQRFSGVFPIDGDSIVALNQFNVTSGQRLITGIDASFHSHIGVADYPVTAGVWADPNNDGNPTDAVLLSATPSQPIAPAGGFHTFPLEKPVDIGIDGTSFFVGIWYQRIGSPISIASDSDGGIGRSWYDIQRMTAPNPNDLSDISIWPMKFDSDFMIRATAVPEPGSLILLSLAAACAFTRRKAR